MPSLADILTGALALPKQPSMYDKLKNEEYLMDPARLKALQDQAAVLQGLGTTDNPWEQRPTRRLPDPDAQAAPLPRRLQNI